MLNQRIGILGGGQLGGMLLQAGISYGLDIKVMDKDATAVCARSTGSFVQGDLMDYEAVVRFGSDCDIITIEIEAVNVAALRTLQQRGVRVYPSPDTIATIQDKWLQKQFLIQHGIPVVPGVLISDKETLQAGKPSLPAVLKRCRDGYDGRGVMMLRQPEDLETAFDAPSVLEPLVDIAQEIAVIVSRNDSGEMACFDPVSMVFDPQLHLLAYQLCPAPIGKSLAGRAFELSRQIAEALTLTGIMAVEMFVTRQGDLLVNELAPRPHNSGHHTIEASVTSQFEQHLRAILNLPPGSACTRNPSVMINLVGGDGPLLPPDVLGSILAMEDVHLHWYGKGERKGRKLGHITVVAATPESATARGEAVRTLLISKP